MARDVPGTIPVEGREFIYIEWNNTETFSAFFQKIPTCGDSPFPTSGGSINENAIIELPDGRQMFGLSYKGDIAGWRRKIIECCETNKLIWATINQQLIKLSNDEEYLLGKCNIELK